MEFISEYVALVQFAGAFNFVFATKFFHEHFSTHFINVSKKQKSNFDNIKNKISTDITTLESKEPLKQNGKSNQHELNTSKHEYKRTLDAINHLDDKIELCIKSKKQPMFSRQLFLLIGLYSLIAIFYIGKIGHLSAHKIDSSHWCNSFWIFTSVTFLWWLYFMVCESLWLIKKSQKPNRKLLSPSFSWTMFLFLIITIFVMALNAKCPYMDVNNDCKIYIVTCWLN